MKQMFNLKPKLISHIFLYFLLGILYNLGNPVIPTLIKEIKAPENIFGIFLAIMTFAQVCGTPLWEKLCQKFGRWVMCFGPLGYGIGQLLFAMSPSIYFIFIARFISGFFVVLSFTIHLAYLGDISSNENKKEVLSFSTIGFTIGGSIGYFTGGYLGTINYKLPFTLQFFFGIVFGILFFVLTKNHKLKTTVSENKNKKIFGVSYISSIKKYKKSLIPLIFILVFFYILAVSFFTGVIPYFLSYKFHFPSSSVGEVTGFVILGGAILNFLLVPYIIKKISEKRIFLYFGIVGSIVVTLSLVNFITINFVLFFIVCSIGMSMIETMLSVSTQNTIQTNAEREDVSTLIGINQSIKSLAYLFGAIFSSMAFGKNYYYPFVFSVVFFMVCICIYGLYSLKKKNLFIKHR